MAWAEPFDTGSWWARGYVPADIEEKYTLLLRYHLLLGRILLVRSNIWTYWLVPIGHLLTSQYVHSFLLNLLIVHCLLAPRNQKTKKLFFFFFHNLWSSHNFISGLMWNQETNNPWNQLLFIQVTSRALIVLASLLMSSFPLAWHFECCCPYHSLAKICLHFCFVLSTFPSSSFGSTSTKIASPPVCQLISFFDNIYSCPTLWQVGEQMYLIKIISKNLFFDFFMWRFQRIC